MKAAIDYVLPDGLTIVTVPDGYEARLKGDTLFIFKNGWSWMKTSTYADFQTGRYIQVSDKNRTELSMLRIKQTKKPVVSKTPATPLIYLGSSYFETAVSA